MTEVCVIGAGPAGLMAAETAARGGARVVVYDRMAAVGRKFLLAGRGGLNLTHSENLAAFLSRYHPPDEKLRRAIEAFSPVDLRAWCEELGQPTFVGTSGRVFPKAMKASPLLRAWLRRLDALGVRLVLRHRWRGWNDEGHLIFEANDGTEATASADATVLALGGASWPRLGSDGGWSDILRDTGVGLTPLRPANCGFLVSWSTVFRDRFAGTPLKRIGLSFEGDAVRGEAMVTREGLEGGAIYALSRVLREVMQKTGEAVLTIDLRPDVEQDTLRARLAAPRGKQSLSNFLRKAAGLLPVAIGLLHETGKGVVATMDASELSALIKALPLRLAGTGAIGQAISTAGGVAFDEIDERFMLRRKPGVFVAGEMLDWEAPTGGYLLQGCFATGLAAGKGALAYALQAKR